MKFLRTLHGVLPCHGICNKQDFRGTNQRFDLPELPHELFIDMKATRGVNQQDVAPGIPCVAESLATKPEWLINSFATENCDVDFLGNNRQLLSGRRTINVSRDQHGPMTISV